ncbi:MAG TPA: RnfH family protein [Gammaproteobacteria bacterium]|nr:RnfH family protein [Gammaproteobacteria bacterium]
MDPLKVRVCWWDQSDFMYQDCFVCPGISVAKLCDKIKLDLGGCMISCYGSKVTGDYIVQDGDRVELHSPIRIDVKEARRIRSRLNNKGGKV